MIKPRISLVVITYNQEDIIGRCLDSILVQKEYGLMEIIVCDDCSTDGNWQVIQEYQEKYPQYIRAYRNEQNKGIYGNLQHALAYIEDTDLIQMCSGDDALCPGYLNSIINYIIEFKIDNFKNKFVIYSDWKSSNPENIEKVFLNNYIEKGYNASSLKLRHIIFNRSTFLSYGTIKSIHRVPTNRGVSVAENLFDIQTQIHSDKNYYCPYMGTIYYSGIGVSTKMNDEEHFRNLIESYEEYIMLGIFDAKDIRYIKYLICRLSYRINKTFIGYLKTWYYYFSSIRYRINVKFIIIDMLHMIFKK